MTRFKKLRAMRLRRPFAIALFHFSQAKAIPITATIIQSPLVRSIER